MSSRLTTIKEKAVSLARADHGCLLVLSFAANLLTFALTLVSSQFPLFDASPHVLLPPPPHFSLRHTLASAVLRWDAFHFAHIAREGYVYEYEWAFLPGVPWIMSHIVHLGPVLGRSARAAPRWELLLSRALWSSILSMFSAHALYDLTALQFGSRPIALLAALLSLLPSSPVTLRIAGYTETFFTLSSYQGMLCCAKKQWLWATFCFMLASAFRSNGILLSGFILWGLVVEPLLESSKIRVGRTLYAAALCALVLAPFVYYQYVAYRLFCLNVPSPAPWCAASPPSIYTYVQRKYWNSGFLLYWTRQQIPNFLLGAPPLILLFTFTLRYIRLALLPRLHAFISPPTPTGAKSSDAPTPPFLPRSIAPHVIHALILSLLLLFASHTQIVLRAAASMPLTYWAAAWLLVERPAWGRWWVGWSVIWGAVSCVLWGVFLPPA
ncbi:GPI mannosyltransferase 2 [Trametes pubescens]|uniref:GPI mannosyltransferase 2 n=1 Tax=Trametes pubescens TaxID=154538 RepID=A0A1M2VGC7_TRAPU|nr:GPI mannosyltransferase 2 [Trametes pubescens]